jgi:tripartite-type tricarboxylate transporter receptor subunit TctC
LHEETVRVLQAPEVKERFFSSGVEVVASTPTEIAAVIKSESSRLGEVIRKAGIRGAK